jgi:hypothetical protein
MDMDPNITPTGDGNEREDTVISDAKTKRVKCYSYLT